VTPLLRLAAAAALLAPATARAQAAGPALLADINAARTDPPAYAARLRAEAAAPASAPGLGQEDPAAVREAIGFLARQAPLPPVAADARLERMAEAYVVEQGPTGQVGHTGPDGAGLEARMRRVGTAFRAGGEVLAYGPVSTHDAVRQLIVDSQVPGRGHRRNIFDKAFTAAGAACGPHQRYRIMCVVDFGGSPSAPSSPPPIDAHSIGMNTEWRTWPATAREM
jgi:uncharacterized protein YkwD